MTDDRFASQLLAGRPAASVEAVVGRLLAVQAQDLRGARLAVRARSSGLTAAEVDHALTVDRSVVVAWLNRGTLHLVLADDYPWLQGLTAPRTVTANRRRLAQEGVPAGDVERGVGVIAASVERHGPLTRLQLKERLDVAGVRTEGQALVHLLVAASLRGLVVRGPVVGTGQAFVSTRDWLGATAPVDRERALAELARRYLAGHGPADERDLARWSGLPLGDVRAGLRSIGGELVEHPGGLVGLAPARRRPPPPAPRLLGPFDPLLLGWSSRHALVGPFRGVVTTNGIVRAVALVDGKVAGTWTTGRGPLTLTAPDGIPPSELDALRDDARDVARFLGSPGLVPMAVVGPVGPVGPDGGP